MEIIDIGRQVSSKAEEFSNCLTKLKNVSESINDNYKGALATDLINNLNSDISEYSNLSNKLNEIGLFLQSVGETYLKVREENLNGLQEG